MLNTMDGSHKCDVEGKKPEAKEHMLYNLTDIKFKSMLLDVRIVFALEE